MKKLLLVFAGVLSSVCLIAGCGANNNSASSAVDDAKQAGERIMDGTQNVIDNVTDMGAAQTNNMKHSDKTRFIGEEKAKSIALEKAGLSADGVTFEKVELDRDNGVWLYEVEFRKDRTEYDADIKADDGKILSWEADTDN